MHSSPKTYRVNFMESISIKKQTMEQNLTVGLFKIDSPSVDYIVLKTHKDGLFFIPYCNIIRVEAAQSYALFYFTDGTNFLCSHNLSYYSQRLNQSCFQRIHKSHIINMNHLGEIIKDEKVNKVIMKDSTIIKISRRRVDSFLSLNHSMNVECAS